MKSGKMSDWQVGEYNYIYRIYSLKVIQTYRIHPTNKKEQSLIFHSLSRAYTQINLGGGVKYFFAPSPWSSLGGGQNLNRKFKTFGFLNTLKVHIHNTVQLPYKDYFISSSNKTVRKKQQINVFNTLHSSVSDLKSVIALSSRGGKGLGRGTAPFHPLYTFAPYIFETGDLCNLFLSRAE